MLQTRKHPLFIAVVLSFSCANTTHQVQHSSPTSGNIVKPVLYTVDEGENKSIRSEAVFCSEDTLAGKFKVPREPDTGPAVALALFLGEQTTADVIVNSDDALIDIFIYKENDPPLTSMCLVWGLKGLRNVPDFITCRTGEEYNGKIVFQLFPRSYAVDIDGEAKEDFRKYKTFIDKTPDGNICDQDFVEL